jgi:hypothetical protein
VIHSQNLKEQGARQVIRIAVSSQFQMSTEIVFFSLSLFFQHENHIESGASLSRGVGEPTHFHYISFRKIIIMKKKNKKSLHYYIYVERTYNAFHS